MKQKSNRVSGRVTEKAPTLKALSIMQPWVHAILFEGKNAVRMDCGTWQPRCNR